jgi:HSP20 family protein
MAMEVMRRPTGPLAGTDLAREVLPLRTMMDRLLDTAFAPSAWGGWNGAGAAGFGADVYETDTGYTIQCVLPGLDPQNVAVTVQDNVLTISGERARRGPEGARPVFQEIGYGAFRRQFMLPAPVEAGRAEATYEGGLLNVTLPKAESARPKTIQVHGKSGG